MKKCNIAMIQPKVENRKRQNLKLIEKKIDEACRKEVDIICLPEMWVCQYSPEAVIEAAEDIKGRTYQILSRKAKQHGVYIIGGSIPIKAIGFEEDSAEKSVKKHIKNTCFVFDRSGKCIHKYEKSHLFDVDIPTAVSFKESSFTIPGHRVDVFDTEFGKMGAAICYDVRFPDLFIDLANAGAKVIFAPSAFTKETGAAHWDLLIRARALDSSSYVIGSQRAENDEAGYVCYGHSMVADPWGSVTASLDKNPGILYTTIDIDVADTARERLKIIRK